MPSRPTVTVYDLDLEQLQVHVAQARLHLQAIERLLPGIEPLGEEDRECAPAIVDAEAADAFAAVLDVMELAPGDFQDLPWDADLWEPGDDFDLDPLRERLQGWRLLQPLHEDLARTTQKIGDCALSMGALVREVLETFAAGRALDLATEDPLLARALGASAAYWRLWAPRFRLKP